MYVQFFLRYVLFIIFDSAMEQVSTVVLSRRDLEYV